MGGRGGAYLEISRVALPPTFIWTTPSSHPMRLSVGVDSASQGSSDRRPLTLDDLANADLGDEVAAANRAIEP